MWHNIWQFLKSFNLKFETTESSLKYALQFDIFDIH